MERSEWSDDAGYPGGPVPPHERAWRHPSEIGQAVWVQAEPAVAIGRRLFTTVVVVGTVVAAGIAWAMLSTDPGRAPAAQVPPPLPEPVLATMVFLEQPAGGWSVSTVGNVSTTPSLPPVAPPAPTKRPRPTRAGTPRTPSTQPAESAPAQHPPTASTNEATTRTTSEGSARTTSVGSAGTTPEVSAGTTSQASAGTTSLTTTAAAPSLAELPTVAVAGDALIVPILDGRLAVALGADVPPVGHTIALDAGAAEARVMLNESSDSLAILYLGHGGDTGIDVAAVPEVGALVVIEPTDSNLDTAIVTVVGVGRRRLTVDGSCPWPAAVRTMQGQLVGLCTGSDHEVATLGTPAELLDTMQAMAEQADATLTTAA